MKKLFITIMVVIFIFSGCSVSHSYQQSIYDDDAKIAKQGDSYTFAKRTGYSNENEMLLNYNRFSGKQVIWKISAVKDTMLNVSIDSRVKSGEFKVCLINLDLKVLVVSENTCDRNVKLPITKGENQIAIVGYKASGEVDIAIQGNESVSIKVNE